MVELVLSRISGFIDISFLFPRRVDSAIAGLEEAKNPAGKILRLIQIRLMTSSVEKLANLSKQIRGKRESPIHLLHTATTK